MITEEAIIELMDDYQDHHPPAEAAYLAASGASIEVINKNLRKRYGSGQGYADFKRDLGELGDFEVVEHVSQLAIRFDESSKKLDDVTADDVDMPVASVIRNAFVENVIPELQIEAQDRLAELSDEANLLAGIALKGYRLDLWDDNPTESNIWRPFTLLTGENYPDHDRTNYFEELVEVGCIYSGKRGNLTLTPMFVRLDNPFEELDDPAVIFDENAP